MPTKESTNQVDPRAVGVFVAGIVAVVIGFIAMGVSNSSGQQEAVQPTDVEASSTTEEAEREPEPAIEPISLSGTSKAATDTFRLTYGLARIKMTHTGSSNFAVALMDTEGNQLELLVNEIGAFDGSTAIQVPINGDYLLDVEADGAWTIDIAQ